ncbi:hypothetical protein N7471_000213 [Penicillium samsonianum]|uniref:uncharacterized protein n=1 Tax=Penicillium samsonianum TaxID=1882272 RepID=UPI0025467B9B|nr:uncharacterized protein N7471_000213 [Penicillium samsonianum]KAJ6149014.1 hypothetical protein N7471_000213 [Penicillium samsonianum]
MDLVVGVRVRRPLLIFEFGVEGYCGYQSVEDSYLVKWNKMSYFRVTWLTGDWVWSKAPASQMKAFLKSDRSTKPIMTTVEAVPEGKR